MSDTVILHSRFNRVAAAFVWAGSAVLIATALADAGTGTLWLYPGAVLLAVWAYVALWQPHVAVTAEGVHLENVTHTVDVPWHALIHVETRYALTLVTPHGRFAAWAAPAPGVLRAAAAGRRPDNRETRAAGGAPRPGDLAGTESGDAAMIIRERWQERIARGEVAVGIADDAQVSRRPRVTAISAVLVAAAATAILFALR